MWLYINTTRQDKHMDRLNEGRAAIGRVQGEISAVIAQRGAVIVFVILALMLIVLIIAYLVWKISRSSMASTDVLKEPKKLTGKPTKVSADKLPPASVGQGYSLSFWLYLTGFQPTAKGKLVLARCQTASTINSSNIGNTNPVVFLDKSTNKMHICVKTTRAFTANPTSLEDLLRKEKAASAGTGGNWSYLVATVDYVPMQRWSMFVLTVQDSTMTVFQDGSIYTVKSLYDMIDENSSTARPMFASVSGPMTIGNPGTSLSGDVNGFIARVKAYNYALATHQVQLIYAGGPTSVNPLRGFGVPAYGVRSPVYKMGDDEEADKKGT